MTADQVPALSLTEVYPDNQVEQQRLRYEAIAKTFEEVYGTKPLLFARSPGRVNLIGEHVDYSGFSVLPMALSVDIVVAVAPTSGDDKSQCRLGNVQSQFSETSFPAKRDLDIDASLHAWSNYFKCGYRGVLELSTAGKALGDADIQGLDFLVDGSVPPGGGLSSSSALVCAAAVATVRAYNLDVSRHELARITPMSERYVGTMSGGMDQAISILGQRDQALRIDFDPVQDTIIPLPAGATFVITNTLVESNKYVTASTNYNLRVVECRMAAAMIAKHRGVTDWPSIRTLRQCIERLDISKVDALGEVRKVLTKDVYTIDDVAEALGANADDVRTKLMMNEATGKLATDATEFKVRQRAMHVFTEALRVFNFQDICGDEELSDSEKLDRLGGLMNGSHFSNGQLFECSCPELDEMTAIAREHGAMGSRLTGAGWGGCAVSLVHDRNAPALVDALRELYYKPAGFEDARVDLAIVSSKPCQGAAFVKFNGQE